MTNENVTKDGFIVDMANSKYLQVNIKKEVLSEGKKRISRGYKIQQTG